MGTRTTSPRSPTASARSSTAMDLHLPGRQVDGQDLARSAGSRSPRPCPPPACSGCTGEEGRHRPRGGRRRRDLRPQRPHVDRHRRGTDAPHEHGLLGLGGVRDRRPRRHRPVSRGTVIVDESALRRDARARAVRQARPLAVPDLMPHNQTRHGLRGRAPDRPAGLAADRPREAGRGVRLQPRLDLRLAPALAGAVRPLQPDPGQTKRIIVGPFVTNPATRDWTVTASLCSPRSTRCTATGPICGIGRGDSAVRVINGKPVTLATCARRSHVIRGSSPTAARSSTRAPTLRSRG